MKVRGEQGRPRETANAGCANHRRMTCAPPPLTLQVVVIGVLGHAAVQEGPGEVVHSVLLVLDGLGDDLGIEVVMHTVVQVRLHRQRLIQELLEEILWERTSVTLQYTVNDSTVTKEGQGPTWPLGNRRGSYKMEAAGCTDKGGWVCVPAPRTTVIPTVQEGTPSPAVSRAWGRQPQPEGRISTHTRQQQQNSKATESYAGKGLLQKQCGKEKKTI